jgi:hypothetical protein
VKFDLFSRRQLIHWNPKRLTNSGVDFDGRAPFFPALSFHCISSPLDEDSSIDEAPSVDGNPSSDGGLARHTRAISDETSDPRQDRVARLRQQVRSGTYEIPVTQLVRILADIILRRR